MRGLLVRNGKTLLSGIDPVRRAERAADAVSISDRTLYFCPSVLYGYGLARLLSRLEESAPSSAVLCAEADPELFELTARNIDPALAADKKLLITNLSESQLSSDAEALRQIITLVSDTWGTRTFRRVETIRFTGGFQLFPELYDSIYETLNRQIAADWSNALTLARLGRLYICNALRNISLTALFPSIAELSFGDSPVLVLGAGPSLDEALDSIFRDGRKTDMYNKPESRSFKIVCVDTCLGALKDRGITPDLAVILESQHWNMRDFVGCKGWKTNFAADISAFPASAQILGGGGYLFFTPWTSLRIFKRLKSAGLLPAAVEPLGSVGLTAVALVRCLTGGKIICAGLDFSFTADRYHARGTPGHRSKLNAHTRLSGFANPAAYGECSFAAVSKSGGRVYTNPVMRKYRGLFEQEFGGDERVFDIEGSGLSLGIKTLSMKEAIDALITGDNSSVCPRESVRPRADKSQLNRFYDSEKNRLIELRDMLCGETEMNNTRLNDLVDECDYLWAHFPDCASVRRPVPDEKFYTDVSFLKRVRVELDSALRLISHFV